MLHLLVFQTMCLIALSTGPIVFTVQSPVATTPTHDTMLGCQLTSCVHGICLPHSNGTHECFCENGYTGVECETNYDDCVSSPCLNDGQCIDGIGRVDCICNKSFTGTFCEKEFTHCSSHPCQNGGTCAETEISYNCTCNLGFEGSNCEVDISVCNSTDYAKTPCLNGATCIEGIGISFICSCPTGYEGPRCEIDVNECLSNPCQNNATCVDQVNGFKCVCSYRWTGELCEQKQVLCSTDLCSNKGICLGNLTHHECYCVPDYHGLWCHLRYDECLPHPRCFNGGTCIDGINQFKCICPSRYVGAQCERLCDQRVNCSLMYQEISILTDDPIKYFSDELYSSEFQLSLSIYEDEINSDSYSVKWSINDVTTSFPMENYWETLIENSIEYESDYDFSIAYGIDNEPGENSGSDTANQIIPTNSFAASSGFYRNQPFSSINFVEQQSHPLYTSFIDSDKSLTGYQTTEVEQWSTKTNWLDLFTLTDVGVIFSSKIFFQSFDSVPIASTPTPFNVWSSTADYSTILLTSDDHYNLSWSDPFTNVNTPLIDEFDWSIKTAPFYSDPPATLSAPYNTISKAVKTSPPDCFLDDQWQSDCLESVNQATYTPTFPSFDSQLNSLDWFDDFTRSVSIEREENITATKVIDPSITALHPSSSITAWQSIGFINGCTNDTCNNRGICFSHPLTSDEFFYECLCHLPFGGPFCEKELTSNFVPSFTSSSYLSYILNVSHENLEISVTFQTEFDSGSLLYVDFYNSSCTCERTFIKLEIRAGYVSMAFSCGMTSVITMEEEIRVDDGLTHKVIVGLEWRKSSSEYLELCNSSMQLDQWPPLTGQQHDVKSGCKPHRLFVGGFKWENDRFISSDDDLSTASFKGCLKAMMINNRAVNLVSGANFGQNIKPCTGTNCNFNPCFHGGSCLSGDQNKIRCLCPDGFSGQFCEHQPCPFNHCGRGRCVMLPSNFSRINYFCLCPFGYAGDHCQLKFTHAQRYFHGSVFGYTSFVSYIIDSTYSMCEIQLEFAQIQTHSTQLLLYLEKLDLDQPKNCKRFLTVGTFGENIFLHYNFGFVADTQIVKLNNKLDRDAWTQSLILELTIGRVNLTVNGESVISEFNQLPDYDNSTFILYIGGHEAFNFTGFPQDKIFQTGFKGCMHRTAVYLTSKNNSRALAKISSGRNIDICRSETCLSNTCKNGGTCISDTRDSLKCECSPGWHGTTCQQLQANRLCARTNLCSKWSDCAAVHDSQDYSCKCFYGWTGKYCDQELNISIPYFNGNDSYMSFPSQSIGHQMLLNIEFKALNPDGIIFYVTNNRNLTNRNDFILVALVNGYVEFRIANKNIPSTAVIKSKDRVLLNNTWHKLEVGRNQNKAWIKLDMLETYETEHGKDTIDLSSNFFLGGFAYDTLISNRTSRSFFHGCFQNFSINSKPVLLTNKGGPNLGRNVRECLAL